MRGEMLSQFPHQRDAFIPAYGSPSQSLDEVVNASKQAKFFYHGPVAGFSAERGNKRLNLSPLSINSQVRAMQDNEGVDSLMSASDAKFASMLPSQLLLSSPFQPGSPATLLPSQYHAPNGLSQQSSPPMLTHVDMAAARAVGGRPVIASPPFQTLLSPHGAFFSPSLSNAPAVYGHEPLRQDSMFGLVNTYARANHGSNRTVYLGNLPAQITAKEVLDHVHSGQVESIRMLLEKNCAFISFVNGASAAHFHSDAMLKRMALKGQETKVGWGKSGRMSMSVEIAIQQNGASRNVFLGNLADHMTEADIRTELSKYGPIEMVKLIKEKAICFVHFLSIASAITAVAKLQQEPAWQYPRRVYYGKDRCAYISKTQQQNVAQYLGFGSNNIQGLNAVSYDIISNALAQKSVAAATIATTVGGADNLGNRTIYLGNIHPETTLEEICNVVRGGILHHVRFISDKHICFVTFVDPVAAVTFYTMSNENGLMIHNRRLKIGWGKHSGPLPAAIALAVSGGASRNVYVGNLDDCWTEERLRQDFSEFGEIELVNRLREKSCAFVNFTDLANAVKAIEGIQGKEEYKKLKINFGKDRCGNAPRPMYSNQPAQPMHAKHPDNQPLLYHAGTATIDNPLGVSLDGAQAVPEHGLAFQQPFSKAGGMAQEPVVELNGGSGPLYAFAQSGHHGRGKSISAKMGESSLSSSGGHRRDNSRLHVYPENSLMAPGFAAQEGHPQRRTPIPYQPNHNPSHSFSVSNFPVGAGGDDNDEDDDGGGGGGGGDGRALNQLLSVPSDANKIQHSRTISLPLSFPQVRRYEAVSRHSPTHESNAARSVTEHNGLSNGFAEIYNGAGPDRFTNTLSRLNEEKA